MSFVKLIVKKLRKFKCISLLQLSVELWRNGVLKIVLFYRLEARVLRALGREVLMLDLPEEKVKFVSTLWFGSTALIVATMGTFLAFISFVLSEDRQIRTQRRSRSGKVIVMMFLRFSLTKGFWTSLIEIAARTGDGFIYVTRALVYLIRFIIETLLDIIGMLADSLRILILVLSRGVHMTFVEIRRNIRQSASRTIDSVEASALVSPSLDKPTQADGIGKNNLVDNTASQECRNPRN